MDTALKRVAPLTGVVFVALFVVGGGYLLKGYPQEFPASTAAVESYISGHSSDIKLGAMLLLVSNPFWFIFLGCLYSAVKAKEGGTGRLAVTLVAAAATGTGVALVGECLIAMAAYRAEAGMLTSAAVYFDAANVLRYTGTAAAYSGFALALGLASLRYGAVLPKWLGVVSLLLAVAFVVPPIVWAAMPLGALLLLWVSIALYRDRAGEL
jgi:hypothetical protein